LAMRLSLVALNAARQGAAFFVAVERRAKPLPSRNGSVDQRKSPGWHARIETRASIRLIGLPAGR
jgi:hypothetical protein